MARRGNSAARRCKAVLAVALFAHHDVNEIAHVCGCNLKTAYHWKSGIRTPGPRTLKLWRLYHDEQVLTAAFRGFRVRGDKLIDPRGKVLHASQLEHYEWMIAYAADLARRMGPAEQARFYDEVLPKLQVA